jgi:hypothetical protein
MDAPVLRPDVKVYLVHAQHWNGEQTMSTTIETSAAADWAQATAAALFAISSAAGYTLTGIRLIEMRVQGIWFKITAGDGK